MFTLARSLHSREFQMGTNMLIFVQTCSPFLSLLLLEFHMNLIFACILIGVVKALGMQL